MNADSGEAWSQCEPAEVAVYRAPWLCVWRRAAVMMVAGGVAAGSALVLGADANPNVGVPAAAAVPSAVVAAPQGEVESAPFVVPTVTAGHLNAPPAPQVLVVPPAPAQAPQVPDRDTVFLNLLRGSGAVVITDPAAAIAGARSICPWLRQGHTPAEAAQLAMQNNPLLGVDGAWALNNASVAAYCPELLYRLP